jgi:hypothetical protein
MVHRHWGGKRRHVDLHEHALETNESFQYKEIRNQDPFLAQLPKQRLVHVYLTRQCTHDNHELI